MTNLMVPFPASDPLFKNLEILKLIDIYRLSIVNFVYSTLSFDSPLIFSDWFKYNHEVHTYSTTSASVVNVSNFFDVGSAEPSLNLYIQKARLEKYGKKMTRVSGPLIWNMLPRDIQDRLPHLCNHLKQELKSTLSVNITNIGPPKGRS